MPRRGQMVYHFHKEQVAYLDHCSVTPEVSSLWNAELTSMQVMLDNQLLSKEDRGPNCLEGGAGRGVGRMGFSLSKP
ncbi:hypothetical protein VNO78_32908 [Psophocarpus tetragonolobus]|uniref:Uncharacterized protein n=1 Tax=Psophocarpus tetragonolobus TaxID=3891 RepID=A0AAN9P170_PSOTE